MHLDGHAVRVNGNGGRVPVRRSGPPPRGPRRAVGDSTLHRDGHLELLLNLVIARQSAKPQSPANLSKTGYG